MGIPVLRAVWLRLCLRAARGGSFGKYGGWGEFADTLAQAENRKSRRQVYIHFLIVWATRCSDHSFVEVGRVCEKVLDNV